MSDFFKGLLVRGEYIYILPNQNSYGEREPGIGLWFVIGIVDDFYFTTPDLAEIHNWRRKKRIRIELTLLRWTLFIQIPIKTIGDQKPNRRHNK